MQWRRQEKQALVAVSRGGMTLGHALSVALANRNLFAINAVHYEGERRLDTVKLFNVPDLSGFDELFRNGHVLSGRFRIAAGVIVRQDHAAGTLADRVGEHLPGLGHGAVQPAGGDPLFHDQFALYV